MGRIVQILVISLTLVFVIGHGSSSPIDWDLLGLGGDDTGGDSYFDGSSNDISSSSKPRPPSGKGSSFDASASNAFAADKNIHVPGLTGGDGLDFGLSAANAASFDLHKGDNPPSPSPPPPKPHPPPPPPPPPPPCEKPPRPAPPPYKLRGSYSGGYGGHY